MIARLARIEVAHGRSVYIETLARMRREEEEAWPDLLADMVSSDPDTACGLVDRMRAEHWGRSKHDARSNPRRKRGMR